MLQVPTMFTGVSSLLVPTVDLHCGMATQPSGKASSFSSPPFFWKVIEIIGVRGNKQQTRIVPIIYYGIDEWKWWKYALLCDFLLLFLCLPSLCWWWPGVRCPRLRFRHDRQEPDAWLASLPVSLLFVPPDVSWSILLLTKLELH